MFRLDASLGCTWVVPVHEGPTRAGFDAALRVEAAPLERVKATLGYAHRFSAGILTGQSTWDEVEMGASYIIGRPLWVSARVVYSRAGRPGDVRQYAFAGTVQGTYRVHQLIEVDFGYSHLYRDYNTTKRTDIDRIFAAGRFRW
jgi:hypothetical protein